MEQVKTDPRVRYFDLLACNAFDARSQLGGIRAPTLIITGRDDAITPAPHSELLHHGIPGSQLVIIEDAGHHVPSEKPEQLHQAIADFLTSL